MLCRRAKGQPDKPAAARSSCRQGVADVGYQLLSSPVGFGSMSSISNPRGQTFLSVLMLDPLLREGWSSMPLPASRLLLALFWVGVEATGADA